MRNKKNTILSLLVTLFPALATLLLWNRIPKEIAIHFSLSGEADGYGSRITLLILPLVLFLLQIVTVLALHFDKRQQNQNPKVKNLVLWILPVTSLFVYGFMIAVIFGVSSQTLFIALPVFLGVGFMLIGNYMPKCKYNHNTGVRTVSTLGSEENWYATHRFAGKVWFWGGFGSIFLGFLPISLMLYLYFPFILVIACVPAVYSYFYRLGQIKDGRAKKEDFVLTKKSKGSMIAALIICLLTLAVVLVILFTGNIRITADDALKIEATYHSDLTLDFSEIEEVTYHDNDEDAVRLMGYGSPKLMMGTFESEMLGRHTRYTYVSCDDVIILTLKNGNTLVINQENEGETKALYGLILSKIEK